MEVIPIELVVDSRTAGPWAVLDVKGEVDLYTAPKLRERIVQLVDEGNHRVVVNLEGVEFMDSTGLGVLVSGLKRIREQDGEMALVCTRDQILKVLAITGLSKVFTVHDSVEQATAT